MARNYRSFIALIVLLLLAQCLIPVWAAESAGSTKSQAITSQGFKDILAEGGNTVWIQIALSVYGAAYALERFFRLRRKFIAPKGLSQRAMDLWKNKDFKALETLDAKQPSILSRAINMIVQYRKSSAADVSATVGDMISREIAVHNQRAYPLGVVATLEPLLGLMGMVLGMIQAFRQVASAGALGNPALLASGISEALVTTAVGLAIAIPNLALYHYFKNQTSLYAILLEEETGELMERWFLKKDGSHEG